MIEIVVNRRASNEQFGSRARYKCREDRGDSVQQVCLTFDLKRHIFYRQGDIIRFWTGGSRAPSLAVKSHAEAKMPDGNGWYNRWVMEAAVISVALSAPGWRPETSWLPSYTLRCDSAHTRAVKNIPYLHWKQISVIHIHTGEELKTQSDITTTSCFFWLPWLPGFEYFRRLVDDESVELGGSHSALSTTTKPNPSVHRKAWPNMAEILLHGLAQRRCEWPKSLLLVCRGFMASSQQFDQISKQWAISCLCSE